MLGAHPTLVGAVGSDPAGEEIASALKALGVDVSGVARVADTQTGLSAIFTMPDGSYVGTNVLGKCRWKPYTARTSWRVSAACG